MNYFHFILYFFIINSDPAIQALQALDVLLMKEPNQKSTFYRTTMMEVLPYIPRVSHNVHTILNNFKCIVIYTHN